MSDEDPTLDEELEKLPNRARQHLRETEKKLKQRESEVEEGRKAMRELAAMKAGLNLDSGPGQLFADAYKGEWEPKAVKEAMAKYGIEPTPSQPSEQTAADQEREAERRAAIEGQRPLGEKPGDLKPESWGNPDERLKADMAEAVDKVRATGARDSQAYIEAVRQVQHQHGRVMSDEVD